MESYIKPTLKKTPERIIHNLLQSLAKSSLQENNIVLVSSRKDYLDKKGKHYFGKKM